MIKKDPSSPRQCPSTAAWWKHNIETCASLELPKTYDNWCDTVPAERVCVHVVSPGWGSCPGRRRVCWAQLETGSRWRNPPGPFWRTVARTNTRHKEWGNKGRHGNQNKTQLTFKNNFWKNPSGGEKKKALGGFLSCGGKKKNICCQIRVTLDTSGAEVLRTDRKSAKKESITG